MKEAFKKYNPTKLSRDELHRTFGGLVNEREFQSHYVGTAEGYWTHKIVSCWGFDYKCSRGN